MKAKWALVTGGSSGRASRPRIDSRPKARVFITGRRQEELDQAVEAIEQGAIGVQGDISKIADLDRLYEVIKKQAGVLDVLFANAGGGEFFGSGT